MTEKYTILVISLSASKGASTGFAPAQVRIQNKMASIQKELFLVGENLDLKEYLFLKGKIEIIRIDNTRAITPPSLFGMDRRMA